jgi:hypothetical protein
MSDEKECPDKCDPPRGTSYCADGMGLDWPRSQVGPLQDILPSDGAVLGDSQVSVVGQPLRPPARGNSLTSSRTTFCFLDGSHRTFTNSVATVFVLEILSSRAPGTLLGIHDILRRTITRRPGPTVDYCERDLLGTYIVGGSRWLKPKPAPC